MKLPGCKANNANTTMNSAQEMSLNAVWNSIFCLRDSQLFDCAHYCLLRDGSLTYSHVDGTLTVLCKLSSFIKSQGFPWRCTPLLLQGISPGVSSEEAVQFPGWKLNLLREQNRLTCRFLVSFWPFFSDLLFLPLIGLLFAHSTPNFNLQGTYMYCTCMYTAIISQFLVKTINNL